MKAKTRKSITKRFKTTKSGKILRRLCGQGHYNAKKSGKQRRESRRYTELDPSETKRIKQLLKY